MWVMVRAVRHCSRISEPMKPVAPARTILGIVVWLFVGFGWLVVVLEEVGLFVVRSGL